ncbi:hypothetical protein J3R82DRAFT_402 [Butyriboletus roseoflavus]|nr:hypothetical protein J3R82DRAFT_402 [Butyriboletus roseoflavus]
MLGVHRLLGFFQHFVASKPDRRRLYHKYFLLGSPRTGSSPAAYLSGIDNRRTATVAFRQVQWKLPHVTNASVLFQCGYFQITHTEHRLDKHGPTSCYCARGEHASTQPATESSSDRRHRGDAFLRQRRRAPTTGHKRARYSQTQERGNSYCVRRYDDDTSAAPQDQSEDLQVSASVHVHRCHIVGHVGGESRKDQGNSVYALRNTRPYCSFHSGSRAEDCGNRFVSNVIQELTQVQGSSFATGVEVQDRRKRVLVISTGSKSVDAILGGKKLCLTKKKGI